jgi:hypothetical protein
MKYLLKFFVLIGMILVTMNTSFALSVEKRTAIMYLAQPSFSGGKLLFCLTGSRDIKVEMVDFSENSIYFSIDSKKYSPSELSKVTKSKSKVAFGLTSKSQKLKITQESDGPILLGNWNYAVYNRYFFRIDFSDFKISHKKLVFTYNDGVFYDISLRELNQYMRNSNTFNGKIFVVQKDGSLMVNHGAWVGKEEPSLSRLAKRIIKDAKTSTEEVQAFLDFVNNQIDYNHLETVVSFETMKNPNEVLMVGNGDCSGKTTLLASLLEQAGFSYQLVYFENHIAVGVACSPNSNLGRGLVFEWRNKQYLVIESTAPGFKIGDPPLSKKGIKYVQRPGEDLYNFSSGKRLPYKK